MYIHGKTPLHAAAEREHLEVCQLPTSYLINWKTKIQAMLEDGSNYTHGGMQINYSNVYQNKKSCE